MAVSYVEDYEQVTGRQREAVVETKVIGAPEVAAPQPQVVAETKAEGQ